MDDTQVEQVRSFNRTVTQRVGALSDEYLARGRPLGASRLLWELGDGMNVRGLRRRLGLDSGYCSRLLRRLEDEGLVTVTPDPADRRARIARPTDAGARERALLDAGSDELAASLLAPLSDHQRTTLVDAMATVERLLAAGLVEVSIEDPRTDDARACIAAYYREMDERMASGFDPARARPLDPDQMTAPAGLLLVARLGGRAIGCGALAFHDDTAEVKRVWLARSTRGLGLGRRLMVLLEDHAREHGVAHLQLDTNSALVEAIGLYRSMGWVEGPRFNDEAHADRWFTKSLAPAATGG